MTLERGLLRPFAVFALCAGFLLAGASARAQCTAAPPDLVSWWPGDDSAADVVGAGHGTLVNGATFADGTVGRAFSLSRSADRYVEIPDAPVFDPTGAFSVDGWFYIDPGANAGAVATLVSKWDSGYAPGWGMDFVDRTGDGYDRTLRAAVRSSSGLLLEARLEQAVTAARWYHVAAVFDPLAMPRLKLYVDGAHVASSAGVIDAVGANSLNVRIGASYWWETYGVASDRLDGMADEVEFFGRALAAEEVAAIHGAGAAGKCKPSCLRPLSGLVGWWAGDGHPTDLAGSSHATPVGAVGYAAGQVGQAFSFDGASRLDVPGVADPGAAPFSVEFWMKSNDAGSNTYLLGKSHADGGLGWDVRLDAGTIRVVGVNGWGFNITSAASVSTGSWHHVALSTAVTAVELWIDGALAGTSPRAAISSTSNPFRIGYTTNYGGPAFSGLLDEVSLYGRALSGGEIAAAYAAARCRPSCSAPPSGLVAWWAADGSARDFAGSSHGTPANGAGYAAGKSGWAFAFDGTDDYVSVPAAASTLIDDQRGTLSAWVYPTAVGDNDMVAVFGSGADGQGIGLGIFGTVRIYHHTGAYDWQSTTPVSANEWTLLTYTWDATTERIYKNGVFTESRPRNFSYVAGQARIGHGFWGDPANAFPGRIDEVDAYDRVLSAAEVAALYDAGSAGKCRTCGPLPSDVVSRWAGEDDATDSEGANHGALQGGAGYALGLVGRAFATNGSDGFVSVPDSESLRFEPTAPMSIEGWFYRTSTASAQHILGKRSSCFGETFDYQLVLDGNGICFAANDGLAYLACTAGGLGDLPLNTWTHVAATSDGSWLRVYVDGALRGEAAGRLGPPDSAALTLGTSGTCHQYGQGFGGRLDEVAVYARALSASEIAAIHAAGSGGVCTFDTTPDPFAFVDQSNVAPGTLVTSNPITVSGIEAPAPVSIVGGEYAVDGGDWSATDGTVVDGDSVRVRQTSSASWSTTTDATLTIGNVSDTFSVTTVAGRTLTVAAAGAATGGVTSEPAGIDCGTDCTEVYADGTTVVLTATPAAGAAFVGWSGDCTGSQNPYSLAMDADKGCTASFDPRTVVLGTRTKAAGPAPFVADGPVTYTIVLANTGNSAQADNDGPELVDVLPAELTGISAGATAGTVAVQGSTVSWDGSIPGGGSVTVTIEASIAATVALDTTISNQAQVRYDADADGTNESTALTDDPAAGGEEDPTSFVVVSPEMSFFTLEPCRLVDTRDPEGTYGGPALVAGASRTFPLFGRCGIPATARAVSVNVTVAAPTTQGHLRLYPGGAALPTVSTVNYVAGTTRANNAVAALNGLGELAVYCGQGSGTAHFVLDVNGYFEGAFLRLVSPRPDHDSAYRTRPPGGP
jgi:uncharacterized repeat protein (TIGR01451 family)